MSVGEDNWRRDLDRERSGDEGHLAWIWQGIERQGVAAVVALLVTWGNLWLGIFAAINGALIGGFLALLGSFGPSGFLLSGVVPGWLLETAGAGTFAAGAALGAILGLGVGILGTAIAAQSAEGVAWAAIFGHLVFGVVLAAAILAVWLYAERRVLAVAYGARRMSDREAERVEPLMSEIASRMELERSPEVMVLEKPGLNAHAHINRLSITRMYLNQLEDEELTAILAHELKHWRTADGVGLAVIKAVSAPIILLYNLLLFAASLHQLVGALAFLFLWPFWVVVRLIIIPITGIYQRRYEYEADRAAVDAGYGDALHRALEEYQDLEPGRDGFERSLAATHPPTELRIEAIRKRVAEISGNAENAGGEREAVR